MKKKKEATRSTNTRPSFKLLRKRRGQRFGAIHFIPNKVSPSLTRTGFEATCAVKEYFFNTEMISVLRGQVHTSNNANF